MWNIITLLNLPKKCSHCLTQTSLNVSLNEPWGLKFWCPAKKWIIMSVYSDMGNAETKSRNGGRQVQQQKLIVFYIIIFFLKWIWSMRWTQSNRKQDEISGIWQYTETIYNKNIPWESFTFPNHLISFNLSIFLISTIVILSCVLFELFQMVVNTYILTIWSREKKRSLTVMSVTGYILHQNRWGVWSLTEDRCADLN